MDRRLFIEAILGGSTIGGFTNLSTKDDAEVVRLNTGLYKARILKANSTNGNSRIYPQALLQKLAHDPLPPIGMIDAGAFAFSQIPRALASHLVSDPKIEGDYLTVLIRPLVTLEGTRLEELLGKNKAVFRPAGTGSFQTGTKGIVTIGTDYQIFAVNAYDKDQAASL